MINSVHDFVPVYRGYSLILDIVSIYFRSLCFRIFVQTEKELTKEDERFFWSRPSLVDTPCSKDIPFYFLSTAHLVAISYRRRCVGRPVP